MRNIATGGAPLLGLAAAPHAGASASEEGAWPELSLDLSVSAAR